MEWIEIEKLWEKYLKGYEDNDLGNCGVKLLTKPKSNTKITQNTFALLYLLKKSGEVVSKEEITQAYHDFTGVKTNDFQACRHLATQCGYDITNSGGGINGYRLNGLNVREGFIPNRRKVEITAEGWEKIKNDYQYKCASCGDLEGHPTRYDIRKICKLAMGHMDPKKGLTEDNIIPQCLECNALYKDKFVFNKRGKVLHSTT